MDTNKQNVNTLEMLMKGEWKMKPIDKLKTALEEYLAETDLAPVESLTDAVINVLSIVETHKEIETLQSYLFKKAKK